MVPDATGVELFCPLSDLPEKSYSSGVWTSRSSVFSTLLYELLSAAEAGFL